MSHATNKIILNWLITLTLIFIISIAFIFFYEYTDYIYTFGQTENEYVNVYLSDEEITKISNKLKYENNLLDFEVIEVSNNYILVSNILKRNVKLKFPYNQNSYILELYIDIGKTTLWQKIYNKYMKGMVY